MVETYIPRIDSFTTKEPVEDRSEVAHALR